jgi:hypothetical protein
MHHDLLALLLALDGVQQSRRYHPEGDALFHSLQVFDLARRESDDPVMWAAALFHDVGKADDTDSHDEAGADLLEGLVCPRVVWLVRHHLDLLRSPRLARRRFRGQRELVDLTSLRRWDLGGRRTDARVLPPEAAVDILLGDADALRPPTDESERS